MSTTAIKTSAPNHPPLAVDGQGNPVRVPDGTASFRICHQTTGRPREIIDDNKRIVRFPLDTTCEWLVECYGPDVYRVYALDEVGELLDHVTTLDLTGGERRNSPSVGSALPMLRSAVAPAASAGSDLRFALEAMTQMMKTNSDALRIVTDSHVDLAKTIAVAKGLPRNAAMFMTPPANLRSDESEDEDVDDAEYDEHDAPKTWADVAYTVAEQVTPMISGVVPLLLNKPAATTEATPAASAAVVDVVGEMTPEEMELARKPKWELRDFIDLNYANRKTAAKQKLATIEARGNSKMQAPASSTIQARVMHDPVLMQKLMAIKAQLTADDVRRLMGAIAQMSEEQQTHLLEMIKVAPEDVGTDMCRELLASMNESAAEARA